MTDFVFAIYSCRKNAKKANIIYDRYFPDDIVKKYKILPIIIYGSNESSESLGASETLEELQIIDGRNTLILKVGDDYTSLYAKTLRMCRVINALYPSIIGMFKCDDDIIVNMQAIAFFLGSLARFSNIHYSGTACMVHEKENNDNYLIATGKNIQAVITTPAALYCGGPLYYLSNKALNIITADTEDYSAIFYEDMIVGHILNKQGIYPVNSYLYNDSISKLNLNYSFHNISHNNTLFLRLHGGIGNQLFQVSAGLSLAAKNNMNFIIINSSENKGDFTHTADNNYYLNTVFQSFPKINISDLNFKNTQIFKEKPDQCFTYNDVVLTNDTILTGYFQNEKYTLCAPLLQYCNNYVYSNIVKQFEAILRNSYFIHVRRGDYLQPLYTIDYDTYYTNAIKYVLSKDKNAYFYIVSDDLPYCQSYSVFKSINKSFVDLPALETLYFMSICGMGGICSNSTFSWWGSYLNRNPNKIVTFPSRWINNSWNNDIYYKGSVVIAP